MQKKNQPGKPSSPFGSGVVQRSDDYIPPETEETEEEKAEQEEQEESKDAALSTPKRGLAFRDPEQISLLDYIPKGTLKHLTEAQKDGLENFRNEGPYWMNAAIICRDHLCVYKEKCPLFIHKVARPVGEDCPIERSQMDTMRAVLLSRLPPNEQEDPFTRIMIEDLVMIQIVEARAMGDFAIEGTFEVDDVRGYNPSTNQEIVAKVVHRAVAVLEKTGKRKDRLLAKLLATPKDRADAKRDGAFDRSRKAAELGSRIADVAQRRRDEMRDSVYVIERVPVQDAESSEED